MCVWHVKALQNINHVVVPQFINSNWDVHHIVSTVTRKLPVNSNGLHGEVDVQLSLFGLLLLTQPLHSSEQHTRANFNSPDKKELPKPL